ncbi:ubiquitin-like domain-containing CTD phosphatase 1 isoform X4 [Ctenocephalides felis]|uniref:ubiquitin-like domain-containing CTD phosphatase 1 isoform X4 n=1 Tax=Ctenocephalides felis TaxID=7515 RepID=UPI000E6E42C7|nr:ubiquitin-like domain-containing CTD phosphatase 1 isoform X4 [Ctenocephalides felis]
MDCEVKLIVKWNGKEYEILNLSQNDTVADLKDAIQKQTGVRSDRQKLLNLKLKGKTPTDDATLDSFKFKPGFKLMLMGSLEEDIANISKVPTDIPEVLSDLDIEEVEVPIEHRDIYKAKIDKRIKEYKIDIINEPRPGKKLLVLDIDYTLFDHRSSAESALELMRPYLHQFLASAYEDYDIIIWSATGMKWIDEKMKLLGVSNNPDYKIMCHVDGRAMISVDLPKIGLVDVKPLAVIWGKFSQYSPKNTIMFDDIRRNFLMNPQSGLRIRAFRNAHQNRDKDKELLYLAIYLKNIAIHCDNFEELNHRKWEKYSPSK